MLMIYGNIMVPLLLLPSLLLSSTAHQGVSDYFYIHVYPNIPPLLHPTVIKVTYS